MNTNTNYYKKLEQEKKEIEYISSKITNLILLSLTIKIFFYNFIVYITKDNLIIIYESFFTAKCLLLNSFIITISALFDKNFYQLKYYWINYTYIIPLLLVLSIYSVNDNLLVFFTCTFLLFLSLFTLYIFYNQIKILKPHYTYYILKKHKVVPQTQVFFENNIKFNSVLKYIALNIFIKFLNVFKKKYFYFQILNIILDLIKLHAIYIYFNSKNYKFFSTFFVIFISVTTIVIQICVIIKDWFSYCNFIWLIYFITNLNLLSPDFLLLKYFIKILHQ